MVYITAGQFKGKYGVLTGDILNSPQSTSYAIKLKRKGCGLIVYLKQSQFEKLVKF